MRNPLAPTYHLAVNKNKEAVVYRRVPPFAFYLLPLLPLALLSALCWKGASLAHLGLALTIFKQATLLLCVAIPGTIILLILCEMAGVQVFDPLHKALTYPSEEQVKALLPALTLKSYSHLPFHLEGEYYYADANFNSGCTCLVSHTSKKANALVKALLKAEREKQALEEVHKNAQVAREEAEAEIVVRKLWQ